MHTQFQPKKEFLCAYQNVVVGMLHTVKRNYSYRPAANDFVAQIAFNHSVAWIEWRGHLFEHESIDNGTQSLWLTQAVQSVLQSAIGLLSDAGIAYIYSLVLK
jgi:hypothetical protein